MIIHCPQCKTRYKIEELEIPLSGRKMRCSKCGEIWRAYPQELPEFENTIQQEQPEPPAAEEQKDISAPKTETTAVSSSQNLCFWLSLLKIVAFLLLILAGIAAYVFRYPIVGHFPQLAPLCHKIGLDCTVPGQGLEFRDISFYEYDDPDSLVHKMDISGKIVNPTPQNLTLPLLHIELLDEEGNILQNVEQALSGNIVKAETITEFKTTILNPAPFTKYVYVTFTDNN